MSLITASQRKFKVLEGSYDVLLVVWTYEVCSVYVLCPLRCFGVKSTKNTNDGASP